ncbi:exosortase D (VPLPA-CTERM-specific) [Alteromonadaceae bacterium 2753L.S.0a.02]|nr:exosortase D (VPLPA-CTERM-specific) [Alteromonadaceae bacterium 2753L.S.0a.02]
MMNAVEVSKQFIKPNDITGALLSLYAVAVIVFSPSLFQLFQDWLASPEYGHGILVTGIAVYLVWRRRNLTSHLELKPDALGLVYLIVTLLFYLFSLLGDLKVGKYYAFVCALIAIACTLGGWRLVRALAFPLILLFFSIPLHPFFINHLTSDLQLISSSIGVWFIHLMGIPALQEGNVINMGDFALLVEEACSGLRYLLPLTSIALIVGYYYRGAKITRIGIFLSAIPITVFMNSLRIAVTGFLIKYFGEEVADGFLHDFEGWFVFVVSCCLLGLLLVVLAVFNGRRLSVSDNFVVADAYAPGEKNNAAPSFLYKALLGCILVGGLAVDVVWYMKHEVIPQRNMFDRFPLSIAQRDLYPDVIEDRLLQILKVDDYFIGDYLARGQLPINLYMAYYNSQTEGSLIHSPADCIPAGGWEILESRQIRLDDLGFDGAGNRAIIEKSGQQLLVYFWVNQQGKNFASEAEVYRSLILRSIVHSRTDATLIRVYVPVTDLADSEAQLRDFITALSGQVDNYLPR